MRYLIPCILVFLLLLSPIQAPAQVNISGTLLGADGQPMAMAHMIVQNGPRDTTVIAPVNASGRFAFMLNEPGGYGVYAIGVHHETLKMPLVLMSREDIVLNIRLGTHRMNSAVDSVQVVMPTSEEGVDMQRLPDGTFAVRVETDADTIAYQIHGASVLSLWGSDVLVAGTSQDRIHFMETGPFWHLTRNNYYSVLDVDNRQFVDITLDPSALPRHVVGPTVSSVPPTTGEIAAIHLEVDQRSLRRAMARRYNNSQHAEIAEQERAVIEERLDRERDPVLRQWLIMRYFDRMKPPPSRKNRRLAREALKTIPPDSPLWSFEAWSSVGAHNLMFYIGRMEKDKERVTAYIRQVIASHPDPDVHRQFLDRGLNHADYQGDEEAKWRFYAELQAVYPETEDAEHARRKFAPDRRLQTGNPVPQFSFASLEDPTVTFTDRKLRGRIYLIDFWGTWCGPCIEELPALHEVRDKYKEAGFDILSIAMQDETVAVEEFRKDRYSMPWMHTLVEAADHEAVSTAFEIVSYPRPILVDEEGIIIAIDDELRDGKIQKVISRVMTRQSGN